MKTPKMPTEFYFAPKNDRFNRSYAVKWRDIYFVSHNGTEVWQWDAKQFEQEILDGKYVISQKGQYKWMSTGTGEVVKNFWEVIRAIWVDLTKFHIWNIKWVYNKNGH